MKQNKIIEKISANSGMYNEIQADESKKSTYDHVRYLLWKYQEPQTASSHNLAFDSATASVL